MIYVFLFIYIYISGKIILNSLDAFLATIVAIILFPFILNGMPFYYKGGIFVNKKKILSLILCCFMALSDV